MRCSDHSPLGPLYPTGRKDCKTYITSGAPYYDQEFLKIDYAGCTDDWKTVVTGYTYSDDYCPIVFERNQPIRVAEFWANHDPDYELVLNFMVYHYIETVSGSNYFYYTV